MALSLSVPLPIFDRNQEARAHSRARILAAEAAGQRVRADVLAELQASQAALRVAAETYKALASTPEVIDREVTPLNQALAAGALDAVSRSQALRRLVEAGSRHDRALHELRVARARWLRRTAGMSSQVDRNGAPPQRAIRPP